MPEDEMFLFKSFSEVPRKFLLENHSSMVLLMFSLMFIVQWVFGCTESIKPVFETDIDWPQDSRTLSTS